jgi:hypothetical protein
MEKPKYRSAFEEKVANVLPPWYEYEAHRFNYTVKRQYVPDFTDDDIWIEVKGFFRAGDVAKYKAIRHDHPEKRLMFVFSNPNKKVRKGAKMSMAQWAEKNGWEWAVIDTVMDQIAFIDKLKYGTE